MSEIKERPREMWNPGAEFHVGRHAEGPQCKEHGCWAVDPPRPQRYLIELVAEKDADHGIAIWFNGSNLEVRGRYGACFSVHDAKPITQAAITAALSPIYSVAMERVKYINFLKNLGIAVED